MKQISWTGSIFSLSLIFNGMFSAAAFSQESPQKPEQAEVVFPLIYYTPETSVAAGGIWIHNLWPVREGKNSYTQVIASITSNQQWIIDFSPHLHFGNGSREVTGQFSYSHFPDLYYGTPNVHLTSPEKVTENNLNLNLGSSYNFYSDWSLRVFGQYRELALQDTQAGGLLEQQIGNFGFRRTKAPGLGLSLDWDSRDYPHAPTHGLYLRSQVTQVWAADMDTCTGISYLASDLDGRTYTRLDQNLVLAQQVFIGSESVSSLPFQLYYFIGGSQKMRGYYRGQYVNTDLVMNQNEVRGQWTDKWGWSVFVSEAKLGQNSADLANSQTFLAAGAGGNYLLDPSNRLKLKIDMAFSKENTGFYFLIGEVF
jgi:outer membrane protein assembly factor BamA